MRSNPVVVLLLGAAVSAASCDSCAGGGGGNSWLVGQGGLMLEVAASTGKKRPYSLTTEHDLLDIECRGQLQAWAVGQGGTLLMTANAGGTWTDAAVGTTETLRGV